jgi:hypothetical protein
LNLLRLGVARDLILDERRGERLEFFKIDRLVEFSQRGGRALVAPEAERPGTIVRGFEQVIEFSQLGAPGVLFDDTAAQ